MVCTLVSRKEYVNTEEDQLSYVSMTMNELRLWLEIVMMQALGRMWQYFNNSSQPLLQCSSTT